MLRAVNPGHHLTPEMALSGVQVLLDPTPCRSLTLYLFLSPLAHIYSFVKDLPPPDHSHPCPDDGGAGSHPLPAADSTRRQQDHQAEFMARVGRAPGSVPGLKEPQKDHYHSHPPN